MEIGEEQSENNYLDIFQSQSQFNPQVIQVPLQSKIINLVKNTST